MTKPFRPMLAGKVDSDKLRFPVLVSAKIDGVRCLCIDGKPMSRSMKVIPNRHIQRLFAEHAAQLEGMDGELIVGSPVPDHPGDDVFNRTVSGVMREDGEPDFIFMVFDRISLGGRDLTGAQFYVRLESLIHDADMVPFVHRVMHYRLHAVTAVDHQEEIFHQAGYEGLMIRDPNGPYKQGRSTTNEGWLLKMKRHVDAEAVIVSFEEEMENQNEATKNELGRTKRSSAQDGLVGKGRLGAFVVRGCYDQPFDNVEFSVGTGIDHASRQAWWDRREELIGKIITYTYLPVGSILRPRHPVFKGFRDPIDMDAPMADEALTNPDMNDVLAALRSPLFA